MHIKETIPFEFKKSKQAISDLICKANEILQNTEDDKMKLQTIGVLANLHQANMNLNSEGNLIQQCYDKVVALEEIQKRRSDEAVFSEQDLKDEDTNPDREPTKITTIDEQDTAPEPDAESEESEE